VNKSLQSLRYNLEEESNEKLNLLCSLATPKLLYMNLGSHKVPFIFQLSPSKFCHTYGVEHYVFHWNDINTMAPVGSVDLLKINHCTLKSDTCFQIAFEPGNKPLQMNNTNDPNTHYTIYEIFSNNNEDCKFFVSALNYLSQLVKCKVYAYKGMDKTKDKNKFI
jgi:hypothetical protein